MLGYATALIYAYNDKKKKNILAPERLYSGKVKAPVLNVDDPDLYEEDWGEEGERETGGGETWKTAGSVEGEGEEVCP